MAYKIVLFGAPGAGKGSQAGLLAEKYGLKHISTGEMFRRHMREGTDIGKEITEVMESGALVNDELTVKIVELEIKGLSTGYILDGFPRTVPQAEMLDSLDKVTHIIDIDVSEKTILERIVNRRCCSNESCGKIYHLIYKVPEKEGLCDSCGSDLYQRDDDTEEKVKARIEEYNTKTKPLLDHYGERMFHVNGDISIEEVFDEICQLL